jgi:hypothetical protein
MNKLGLLKFTSQLRTSGPINPHAVAFILTEMRFRGPFFRACETVYAIWCLYVLRREPKLTLGKCQVSFSYWRKRFGKNNFALLRATADNIANYEICCDYLQGNEGATLKEIITRYNGRPSVLYVSLFYEHLELFNLTICHLDRTSPVANRALFELRSSAFELRCKLKPRH